uniref:Rab8 family GTPase n=1 Tax=Peronospora matthiolae TaxID=2874970 RepID=A0AAV1TAU2_9STRA
MSIVTSLRATDLMQHEEASTSSDHSDTHAQCTWEHEMQRAVETRGRSRSRSILADDEAKSAPAPPSRAACDSSNIRTTSSGRSRSCSFSALEPPHSVSAVQYTAPDDGNCDVNTDGNAAKRAASLSKIYLAGSAPVDVSKLQETGQLSAQKKVEVVQPTGALSAAALDALSEGLQLSVENNAKPLMASATRAAKGEELTEEEIEEKKMEEEEDCKLKAEKLSARRSLAVRASLFRNKMMKSTTRLLGNGVTTEEAAAAAAIAAAATLENERSVELKAVAGVEKPATMLDVAAVDAGGAGPVKKRHKLKLLLLGDSGVGKTSLMRVFSGDEFSESMLATAGVDFKLRHINVADEAITLQIWDTAGQERFHRITSTYYKGANGIVLVYDVSDRRSFDNVGYWMNNIRQYSSPTQMPAMLLVGNKIDLPNRVVALEEGQAAASQYGCRFIETSAKTSENTNGALETIARDGFMISVNPALTQKIVMDREKTLAGRRNKENCVIQ